MVKNILDHAPVSISEGEALMQRTSDAKSGIRHTKNEIKSIHCQMCRNSRRTTTALTRFPKAEEVQGWLNDEGFHKLLPAKRAQDRDRIPVPPRKEISATLAWLRLMKAPSPRLL